MIDHTKSPHPPEAICPAHGLEAMNIYQGGSHRNYSCRTDNCDFQTYRHPCPRCGSYYGGLTEDGCYTTPCPDCATKTAPPHVESCHNREADPVLVPTDECPYCVAFRAGEVAEQERIAKLLCPGCFGGLKRTVAYPNGRAPGIWFHQVDIAPVPSGRPCEATAAWGDPDA